MCMINPSSKAYGLFSRVSLSSNEICYCPLDKDQSSDTCDDFTHQVSEHFINICTLAIPNSLGILAQIHRIFLTL